MARSLFKVSSLFALIALAACAGSEDAGTTGTGGSSSSGSAGTTGSAGTSGSAGTTGAAGTNSAAGTTGTSGTNGTAGTTGSAGSNATGTAGATGTGGSTAGRGGTTGAAGRGGTTGTAGTGGSTTGTAGRGGTGGGTAGTGGARGGTTGTAGVTGGGGQGGCTITATSTLGMIPTVGIVTFTTTASSPTSAEIHFGTSASSLTMVAPVSLTQANYRTLLLGMKGSTTYTYRIIVNSSAGTCTSQDYTVMTGAVPSSVPKLTATISNATAHAKGFYVTSSGIAGTGAYIFDTDGNPVWWSTGPNGTSRIQMSWDGSKMYMMALNVQNSGGSVKIVDMDGNNSTTVSGLTTAHHDMTAIPGGFATVLWNSSGIDAPCSLVERSDSGSMKTVIANINTVYNSNTFHTNSIHYYPSDDTYTLGDRNPNLYVKVSRSGALIWQFGGTNPKDASKNFSGAGTWSVNHGHHLLPDGTFYLFNNGTGNNTTIRGFKLNTSNMTATSTFTYTGSTVNSMVLGDVQALPNGNVLITASTSGQITELTTSMQTVATFKTTALGYTEFRESLYGPPPR